MLVVALAVPAAIVAPVFTRDVEAVRQQEILRYEVTWNGGRAGHGDIRTTGDGSQVQVVVQAVSDGILKAIVEIWSRIQSTHSPKTFKPQQYTFNMRSNRLASELVDLTFDHKKGLVNVEKRKGDERENHSEQTNDVYDPVTAACLLRKQKDFSKPMYVDIYDGKARSRLFVSQGIDDHVQVKAGAFPAIKLDLRLVKLTGGDKGDVGTACLWVSKDPHRIPLLLTSSHRVGTIRFELVQVER
ncbi:MAG: DUF3108 domain-containing protein [Desulfomonile sp.]|nr:DUF3108 domain-containing protein [Desulfomonile sp.]